MPRKYKPQPPVEYRVRWNRADYVSPQSRIMQRRSTAMRKVAQLRRQVSDGGELIWVTVEERSVEKWRDTDVGDDGWWR